MTASPATYRAAGVDVDRAQRFIRAISPLAGLTRRPGLVRGIGSFGGLFELSASGGSRPVLVASADGVGTKLRLAQWVGWYTPLGVDLVAMNVNDILCAGARPLFFLDYIAAGSLEEQLFIKVVRGIVRGCVEAGCVLLGGETAQMPLVYKEGDFDLAGFAVGVVERKKIITGERVRPGDRLLGLAASGLHSNGFTLIQRLFSKRQLKRKGRILLTPTRIYVRPVLDLLKGKAPILGIAHITGGAFYEKIPRVLPEGARVVLRKKSWKVPSIFRWIQAAGVAESEMYRTFNMGIGMVLVASPAASARIAQQLHRRGVETNVIGEVVRGKRGVEIQ